MNNTGRIALVGGLAAAGFLGARALKARTYFELQGKVALITGGSRGLGLVLARELAGRGCPIAICARDEAELQRAIQDLSSQGAEAIAFVCDVTKEDEVERLVGDVLHHFGRIDVLINNAGIIRMAPIDLQTKKDFADAMNIHFWAPVNLIQAALPSMIKQRSGRIVNVSSFAGKVGVPHLASYVASKFALVGYSQSLRSELVKHHIYVTTVCPGLMRTGSHINAEFKGQNEKEFAIFSTLNGLPVTSVSAEHAARCIVRAMARGDAELVISPQAKFAVKFANMLPELTADILAITDRFLPTSEGGQVEASTGLDSRSAASPSVFTSPVDEASERNNELRPGEVIG